MITRKTYVPGSAGTKANIYVLSDIHFGCQNFMKSEYERISDIVKKDKDAYTLFLGDLTDDDRPSTRAMRRAMFADRHDAFTQEDRQHLDWMDRKIIPELNKLITPSKCLGALDGDHYRRYSNGLSSVQYICAKMKIPYMGDGYAGISMCFGSSTGRDCRIMFKLHAQHGIGGIGRPGNGVNKLEDVANQWDNIDCFVRGHNHRAFIYPTAKYYENKFGEICKRDMWLINTPSFRSGVVKGHTDYAEARGYGATPSKFPVLRIVLSKGTANYSLKVSGELI